jgi:hypothetical protein
MPEHAGWSFRQIRCAEAEHARLIGKAAWVARGANSLEDPPSDRDVGTERMYRRRPDAIGKRTARGQRSLCFGRRMRSDMRSSQRMDILLIAGGGSPSRGGRLGDSTASRRLTVAHECRT